MATGGQCVMMDGTAMMLPQCVDNWDTIKLVIHKCHLSLNVCACL